MKLPALFCFFLPLVAHAQMAEGYRLLDAPEKFVSPDGKFVVEQYGKNLTTNQGFTVQQWVFDPARRHATLLNRGETGTINCYGAGFRFSRDSKWLVRMQKTAAGESTLFLYRRVGPDFVPATARQLGDLAWDFLEAQMDIPGNLSPETYLVGGLDNNYANLVSAGRTAAIS